MIIRESGMAAASPPKQAWPPRSPLEALISSPSGRKKLERLRKQASPTPSPRKPPGSRYAPVAPVDGGHSEGEDEETLQLQLQAIEARLKLKRLQQAKVKGFGPRSEAESCREKTPEPSDISAGISLFGPTRAHREFVVPLSPVRNQRAVEKPNSPSRILLGIDKGLRANNMSLKRAPKPNSRQPASVDQRGRRMSPVRSTFDGRGSSILAADRPKSFSERLAESRQNDIDRQAKQERTQKARSRGFSIHSTDTAEQDNAAIMPPPSRPRAKIASKTEPSAVSSHVDELRQRLQSSNTAPQARSPSSQSKALPSHCPPHSRTSSHTFAASAAPVIRSSEDARNVPNALKPENDSGSSGDTATPESTSYESFSGLHLSKRLIPHTSLTRTLSAKEIFTIPHLLKVVKSPDYEPPDVEGDYVVFGIIASKSQPRNHANIRRVASTADEDDTARSKFMIVRLTDLKWEIDLFLFDSGFEQFWKLTLGTVVAILNPGIMPPRPSQRDTGQFSLKLASSEDTVLEVGTARDLGFCTAVRKDGQECGQWVDKRHTEVCEFHIYLQMEEAKKGRMQVNTMSSFGGRGGWKGKGKESASLFGRKGGGRGPDTAVSTQKGIMREGMWHDTFLHETVYIAPNSRGNTAALLDAEDSISSRGFNKSEMRQKRLAEQEKERELARQLGSQGRGMGAEYARLKTSDNSSNSSTQHASLSTEHSTAAALSLISGRASDVHLSPLKRKRGQVSGSEAMGWSGAFQRGLLSPSKMKPRAGTQNFEAPVKKKARFMTEKGIREPGRESLPDGDTGRLGDGWDEEDDLDIV